METSDPTAPLVVRSIAIVGIIWVVMVLGIRLYLRYKLNGPIGNDDYAAILATSLGVAQSAVVLAGVNSGLGHYDAADDGSRDQITRKVTHCPIYLEAATHDTDDQLDRLDMLPHCFTWQQHMSQESPAACYISA